MTTMIRTIKAWLSVAALSLVAACGGGGGDSGDPVLGGGGGGSTAAVSDLAIVLSSQSLSNAVGETVTATVTALDNNRNALANVPVSVAVDNGALATLSGSATGTNGLITAAVSAGGPTTSPRIVTLTAKSGSVTKTTTIQVVGTSSSAAVAGLTLVLSNSVLSNDGSGTMTATVKAVDSNNNVMVGVPVVVAVDNAVAAVSGAVTDASGQVVAQLSIGDDRTPRTVNVTALSGSLSKKASFQIVVGDTTSPRATDLSLALNAASITNSGTTTVTATATAVDANRNALPGIPVTISVDSSAVATVSGSATNSQGVVTATVGIGSNRTNRVITVTAVSGELVRTASFTVIGANIFVNAGESIVAPGSTKIVEYRLVDSNSNPMPSQAVSVTAPGLPAQSGLTDLNGKFLYTYLAPSTPDTSFVITATAAGDTDQFTVTLAQSDTRNPATEDALSASIEVSPSVVGVNEVGSTSNQVEARALFLGVNNKPIANMRVRFDLAGNATNSDGKLAWSGIYAYSDANGVARATFAPGTRASPTNGVVIRACYSRYNFSYPADANISDDCAQSTETKPGASPTAVPTITTTLTVASEALAVSIRTNELIDTSNSLTYIKQFVVMVVDAAGQAKPDVQITPSIDLVGYHKGFYEVVGDRWAQFLTLANTESYSWNGAQWISSTTTQPVCPNEDLNRNGVKEGPAGLTGEDLNSNGELDPRKSDVAIKMVGSSKTDANGLAVVQIEYGRSVASWVDFVITVTAAGVSGTEARAKYSGLLWGVGNLPYPGAAIANKDVAPAFRVSPYGRSTVCTDAK